MPLVPSTFSDRSVRLSAEQANASSSNACSASRNAGILIKRLRFRDGERARHAQRDDEAEARETEDEPEDAADPAAAEPPQRRRRLELATDLQPGFVELAHARDLSASPQCSGWFRPAT